MSMLIAARSSGVCRAVLRAQIQQVNRRTFQEQAAKYFEKHAKRSSPLSPSLAILMKNMPLTAFLSITHRATGMVVGGLAYGMGFVALAWPNHGVEHVLAKIKEIFPDWFLQFSKLGLGKC